MSPIGFTGAPLTRDEATRHDPARLAAIAADPAARLLDLDGYMPHANGDRLATVAMPEVALDELALLGTIDGTPLFARIDPHAVAARRVPELFALLATLQPGEMASYAAARSLLDWHARHRFCASCGTASRVFRAGWGRHCDACGTEHYPRSDPVVIMLAEHGSGADARVLIGRQAAFPPGRYSALAGFVEVGEAVEEAVARELFEEAGVIATAVRYVASQPWPFPSQLMLACVASVADDRLTIDRTELEDARWVTRGQVAAALAGEADAPFDPPPAYAIARTLFEQWVTSA